MTQATSVRDQLKALEHLQELDLKIDQIKKKQAALPVTLKTLDEGFQRANRLVGVRKQSIEDAQKLQRQTEAAMELNRDRLARANAKLEGVHNSQEFTAANKEIDQLKKLNSSLEEQMKKFKSDLDEHEKQLGNLGGDFDKAKQEHDAQSNLMETESRQLQKEIDAFLAERAPHAAKVERSVLGRYDRTRGARAGIGLAPAHSGRCGVCNMILPPQLYNQVQRANEVQECPSCHRLLFAPTPATG